VAEAAAVILAGGRGERLGGVIKANLEIGGIRLIDRLFSAVAGASPVLVARGRLLDADLTLPAGSEAVEDASGFEGPLAGVAGAMRVLAARSGAPAFLLSVAVDTPFFPKTFLAEALARIGDHDAVVARFEGQDFPTNALWRLATVVTVIERFHSLKRLLEQVKTVPLDWPDEGGGNPFANLNTQDDRAALERRETAHFGVGKGGQTR
jgi:molybdenum cofactor guanylyltransferase